MRKLSNGADSTLQEWIKLSISIFGEQSSATIFLKHKAKITPGGLQVEVIADESQVMAILLELDGGEQIAE